MSNNNILDFKVLQSLGKLRAASERIRTMGNTMAGQRQVLEAVNEDLKRSTELQRKVNAILIAHSASWKGVGKKVPTKKALLRVVH